jgi:hypothetical protein
MMKLNFNRNPSRYETLYITWEGIQYDRKKLKKFVRKYNRVLFLSKVFKYYKKELSLLNEVLNHYGRVRIFNLVHNDEYSSKIAHIERLSRQGSIEILTSGTYKPDTYRQISNLPKSDYDLVTKRVQELIKIGQSVYVQDDTIGDQTPSD